MRKGRICDPCRKKFEEAIDGDTYNSLLRLIKYLNDKANSNENLPPKKPKVFIASSSSSDGIKIAEYLQVGLDTVTESTIWSQGSFSLTGGYLESLIKFAPQYDYAIIVLTPDDLITKKGQTVNSPRDMLFSSWACSWEVLAEITHLLSNVVMINWTYLLT